MQTLLTHLSQEVIKLLVARVSLILCKLRQKKGKIRDEIKRYIRNTLLFTSTYSSYSSISNQRVLDVVETENSGIHIGNLVSILTPRNVCNTQLGCSSLSCKFQSLFNCKGWKMYIVFRAILNVATELSRDLAWWKRIVMDIAFDSIELFSLISEDFEKCTTTGSGATKDDWKK